MYDSHVHLWTTQEEWQVFLADFKTTLNNFVIPPTEQNELFAIVESTKPDIVLNEKTK